VKLKTTTDGPPSPDCTKTVSDIFQQLQRSLPGVAVRIEIDVEWADGSRCKMEARA
jgi:hypothetical protein